MNYQKKIFHYKTYSKILIFFFQSIGLLIVKFDKKSKSWKIFSSKKISIFISSVANILHFAWSIHGSMYLHSNFYKNERNFDPTIGFTAGIVSAFLNLLLKMTIAFRLQESSEIANKTMEILSHINFLADSTKKIIKPSVSLSIKLFSIYIILWINAVVIFGIDNFSIFFHIRLLLVINLLIYQSTLLQYSFFLLLIKHTYKILNEGLIKISHQFSIGITQFEIENVVYNLKNLCILHAKISDLTHRVSSYYSVPMFFCICQSFLMLINFCYFGIKPLIRLNEKFDIYLNTLAYIDVVIEIYLLLILGISTTSVIEEVNFCFPEYYI